jgi:hypothetical protein
MRNTALIILGTLLIAGSTVQMVTASEHHARRAHDQRNFRGSFNQLNGPSYAVPLTSEEKQTIENFGFSGRDPSRVGGRDPSLNPSGS